MVGYERRGTAARWYNLSPCYWTVLDAHWQSIDAAPHSFVHQRLYERSSTCLRSQPFAFSALACSFIPRFFTLLGYEWIPELAGISRHHLASLSVNVVVVFTHDASFLALRGSHNIRTASDAPTLLSSFSYSIGASYTRTSSLPTLPQSSSSAHRCACARFFSAFAVAFHPRFSPRITLSAVSGTVLRPSESALCSFLTRWLFSRFTPFSLVFSYGNCHCPAAISRCFRRCWDRFCTHASHAMNCFHFGCRSLSLDILLAVSRISLARS
ncbi:hypothetical protein BOTBODRAFT_510282 [Botryobasidium botryosum FD-172 SS1]|uniref:Uncharacterized protein n=1 Tax=Botryobasidium botryosum (strain FD-172 SS1) TaxID=930990 RepID=A0A067N3M7_BOTB1|nr:hypothetical protein BOTBODRAFT_510282 [Botryobasidium botryosum FD-172 SS1]